jgi:hypothetical protein
VSVDVNGLVVVGPATVLITRDVRQGGILIGDTMDSLRPNGERFWSASSRWCDCDRDARRACDLADEAAAVAWVVAHAAICPTVAAERALKAGRPNFAKIATAADVAVSL